MTQLQLAAVNVRGDAVFQNLLNLASFPEFLVALLATWALQRFAFKTKWGVLPTFVIAFVLMIVYDHWAIPFWNSLDF